MTNPVLLTRTETVGAISLSMQHIEPWVTAEIVAAHLGFKADHIRKLANQGLIPGSVIPGRRRFWRFKLSEVDAAWSKLDLASNVSLTADKKAN